MAGFDWGTEIDLGESYKPQHPTPENSPYPTYGRDYGLGISVTGVDPKGYTYSYNRPEADSNKTSSYTESRPSQSYGSSVTRTPTQKVIGSTTTTSKSIAPDMAMPSFGNVPAIDEARIKRLTQTRSAAGQRALRSALRESLTQASYQDNPNVAAMINRKAMEGFGQGIAETYTRAQKQATEEEARDRGMQMQKQSAVFNAAMQDYMKRFGTESTAKHDFVNPNISSKPQSTNPMGANYITPAHEARNALMAGTYTQIGTSSNRAWVG